MGLVMGISAENTKTRDVGYNPYTWNHMDLSPPSIDPYLIGPLPQLPGQQDDEIFLRPLLVSQIRNPWN